MRKILLAALLIITACVPAQTQTATSQVVKIHSSAVTRPWLIEAYDCAEGKELILVDVNDPAEADISIRLGEPEKLRTPAFKIDEDDLFVVTNRESPVQNLTEDEVRKLFSRPDDPNVQVWVFAGGDDTQQVFEREVMRGQVVTSLARLALSPQQMSDTLNRDKNAIGILPGHWKTGTMRYVFRLTGIPVLAMTKTEPDGLIKNLLACLQK